MPRRRWLARPMSIAMAAALWAVAVSSVAAGGWAEVTVTEPPVDPPAGAGTTIGLQVMQHGVTAVSWPTLMVVATDKVSGQSVSAQATPEGPTGHYVATVTFPKAGTWSLTFLSQDLAMSGFADVQVAPAAVPAATTAPVAPEAGATPSSEAVGPAVWLGIAALAVLAVGLLVAGRRGRRPTTQPG